MPRWTPRPRPCTRRTSRSPASAAASTNDSTTEGMSRGANACRSISDSIGTRTAGSSLPIGLVAGGHRRLDAAADRKIADHGHAARLEQGDQVVQDLVGDALVEDAAVAELDHVVLERLQLDAARVGDVGNPDLAEVGESGLGTHG